MGSDLGKSYSGRRSKAWIWLALSFFSGSGFTFLLLRQYPTSLLIDGRSSHDCEVYLGKYKGNEYRASATIGQPHCLVESKFLKVQQHTLKIGENIIDDWLFIDYHDRVNVLVEAPNQPGWEEPHFYVFEQTKYALEDRMSWAIVGGIIEPGELPEHSAEREVSEEMRVTCKEFVLLGRYRTDVNRGAGWTSTFLARQCEPGVLHDDQVDEANEVGAPDTERQDLRTVSLTEIRKAVSEGKFLEIQWSATVALSMLHLQ